MATALPMQACETNIALPHSPAVQLKILRQDPCLAHKDAHQQVKVELGTQTTGTQSPHLAILHVPEHLGGQAMVNGFFSKVCHHKCIQGQRDQKNRPNKAKAQGS